MTRIARAEMLDPVRLGGGLAAWTTAWLTGRVSSDDVITAVTDGARPHLVTTEPSSTLASLLISWRQAGALRAELVAPVPGDVRGLPGPAPLRTAALEAGSVVIAGGLAAVPAISEAEVRWQLFEAESSPDDPYPVADAEHDLAAALRESAAAFAELGPARWQNDTADALASARRAGDRLPLPTGHPQRAVRLIAQAERVAALADLAADDRHDGSLTARSSEQRRQTVRDLAHTARRARVAGYNADAETR